MKRIAARSDDGDVAALAAWLARQKQQPMLRPRLESRADAACLR
jgi:cytochrome c553